MAAVLGNLVVRIGANIVDFEQKIAKVERSVFFLSDSVTSLGKKMTLGMTVPLTGVGAAAVSAAADFDGLRRGMIAVAGSAGEADKQLSRLRDLARAPGIDLEQAIQGSVRLQAVGMSAQFAERTLRGVANAVALGAGGAEELGGVVRQLQQIASKGRLMGEELTTILENAPAISEALQHAFGTTSAEAIRDLGLTADQFFERLNVGLESLGKASGGAKNSFANLSSATRELGSTLGRELLPALTTMAESLTRIMEGLARTNPEIVRWGVAFGTTLALVGPLTVALGKLLKALVIFNALQLGAQFVRWAAGVKGLSVAIAALKPLLAGVGATLVGGGAVILGLAALSTWFIKNRMDAAAAGTAVDDLRAKLGGLGQEAHRVQLAALDTERWELQRTLANTPETVSVGGHSTKEGDPAVMRANPEYTRIAKQMEVLAAKYAAAEESLESLQQTGGAPPDTGTATVLENLQKHSRALLTLLEETKARGGDTSKILAGVAAAAKQAETIFRSQGGALTETAAEALTLSNQLRGALGPANRLGIAFLRIRNEVTEVGDATRDFVQLLAKQAFGTRKFDHTKGVTFSPELNARATGTLDLRTKTAGRYPMQGSVTPGAGAGAISTFLGAMKTQISGLVSSFGPLAVAAAVLAPVIEGLAPVFEILKEPLRIIGQIIGVQLTPVLKLLAIPLRVLAKASSYVAEGFGWLLRAVGKFVDSLPGISAKGLIRSGEEMMKGARAARAALDGTAEAADKLTNSLSNVPPIFDLALRRRQAAMQGAPPPVPPTTGGGEGYTGGGGGNDGGKGGNGDSAFYARSGSGLTVVINNPPPAMDVEAVTRQVERGIVEKARRGGPTALSLSLAGVR